MTLVKNRPDLICEGIKNLDTDGRLQLTNILHYGTPLSIINMYSPNSRPIRETKFQELIPHLKDNHILLGGDMNFIQNADMDLHCIAIRRKKYEQIGSDAWTTIQDAYHITDLWRNKYPYEKQFSRFDKKGTSTRLDRIYGSLDMNRTMIKGGYLHTSLSDHSLHWVTIKTENTQGSLARGKGTWKLNNSLLQKEHILKALKAYWSIWSDRKEEFRDLRQWWDLGKKGLKSILIKHGINNKHVQDRDEKTS